MVEKTSGRTNSGGKEVKRGSKMGIFGKFLNFFREKSFENLSEVNVWDIKEGQYRNWELT